MFAWCSYLLEKLRIFSLA
uniref:Uncharacterized protein n=1 Tax=Arundo donax TaxID=35708 RepID=A0A0A9G4E1_ARUDO